jgi:hypothetical protein
MTVHEAYERLSREEFDRWFDCRMRRAIPPTGRVRMRSSFAIPASPFALRPVTETSSTHMMELHLSAFNAAAGRRPQ